MKPLAAALGHVPRVLPSPWGAGGGLDKGDGVRRLREWLGDPTALFCAATHWFRALHRLALPSLRAPVDVMVQE